MIRALCEGMELSYIQSNNLLGVLGAISFLRVEFSYLYILGFIQFMPVVPHLFCWFLSCICLLVPMSFHIQSPRLLVVSAHNRRAWQWRSSPCDMDFDGELWHQPSRLLM
ncbi:hypothetical protein F5Y08DRAFT_109305 [Xylaria arbuscula]|nr:hypothetical protein F5Y08DRAFT_109305 [Xylaria arbuscula]